MEYNGHVFICFDEEWKLISYKDIKPFTYEVSNLGRIRKIKNKKILFGNNPENEKGYLRIALTTISGYVKKFPVHRIVLYTFKGLSDDMEVNHINGDKTLNALFNLEETTRSENAKHASVNDLYKKGEKHYKSIFTNKEVDEICRLLSFGKPFSYIIHELKLEDRGDVMSNIHKIASGKTWKDISLKYNISYNKYHYKTYTYEDICKFCHLIFIEKKKNKEIIELFPNYNSKNLNTALKSIRAKRIYKKIIDKYQSSTTIERIN